MITSTHNETKSPPKPRPVSTPASAFAVWVKYSLVYGRLAAAR
jgi:hypothetical protein